MKIGQFYPTFTRVVDTVQKDLIERGLADVLWRNGARCTPMKDTLPGIFYSYTETVRGPTKAENQYIEHWCYSEVRDTGTGKSLTPVVWSAGWREWMFNFQPAICDCVAYHVRVVKERCDEIWPTEAEAERLAEHLSQKKRGEKGARTNATRAA